MQSRVTTPRSTSRGQAAWYEDEGDVSVSASSSRYRVLDEDQKKRETEDVDRLINDLKAQRRCRSSNSRVRKSSSRQEAPVVPIRSGSPRLKDKSERLKLSQRGSGRHSFEDDVGGGDELLPGDEQNPDAVSQSFQDQVLNELRKLKEAQRFEFEALEDCNARKMRLSGKLVTWNNSYGSSSASYLIERVNLLSDLSELETERGDHELIDWDDVTKSPPPYFTTASPATSPFKRSSGWPAWTGDESLPPGPASDPLECSSLESTKPLRHRSRSRSKLEPTSLSRSRSNSAMSSHVRRLSQSRSRSPSATRTNRSAQDSQELRRSCAFFEDKARAQAEAEQRSKESAERLERACRAAPPQKLLERQALADERRSQQLRELDKTNAELAREKRAKPREVPVATYLSAGDAEAAEQKRKERIRQRAQEMVQAAEMPSRMAMATKKATADATPAGEGWSEVDHMSVKLKKKLRQAAEEEAKRRQHRPKPVPNFDQLHSQWDAALKKRMELARRNQHEEDSVNNDDEAPSKKRSAEFFTSRADKLAELREQKEARKLRLQAKEEAIQQHAKRAQEKLLTRARASLGTDVGSQRKPTKSEALRAQKLMAETTKQQKERLREERDADARERRREEATRRVRAQVNRSENVRRDNFAGTFVDLKDLDAVAKEKAREQRQQFKEAIARNKEKLLAAAAARPSLMERFTTGVKRETHRRAALEAVVKTVFQKDLSALKGVLTDDEQELAREMVAADEAKSDKNSEDD
ncbi:hypothetical protein PRIC1_011832 [Phytophthora ramorum]